MQINIEKVSIMETLQVFIVDSKQEVIGDINNALSFNQGMKKSVTFKWLLNRTT